jgi:large subunit ribosomal protein L9
MKIILLQHVKGIGQKGDITEVSDGYAQNALIPKGLAKAATITALNKIKQVASIQKLKKEQEKERTIKILETLNGKNIIIKEKLNEKGSLYHALGLKEIIKSIHEQIKLKVSHDLFKEKYAFKEAGEYTLELKAYNTQSQIFLVITNK